MELPYIGLLLLGFVLRCNQKESTFKLSDFPHIVVNLTAYSEGNLIELAIESLAVQDYPGNTTILVTVDGGSKHNEKTVTAGFAMAKKYPNLDIRVIDKTHRKGRVDSNQVGLAYCLEHNIKYMLILDADTSVSSKTLSSFVTMMEKDPLLSAVSGSIKVRNLNSSIAKLTYIEYAIGIVLSRFSLDAVGYVNNCSGAFSFFRVNDVAKIGGWRMGTAEDLDLTLRMYIHKYKIAHCSDAVAYTDSPESFLQLCKQRLTWSGDIVFLLKRYFDYLTPKYLGWKIFFFIWYNLLITVSLPFCVLIYTVFLLLSYPLTMVILICSVIYMLYFYVSCILFTLYLKLCKEKNISYELILHLLLQPLYSWTLRMNDIIAFILELFFHNHLKSKMAPFRTLIRADLENPEKYFNL